MIYAFSQNEFQSHPGFGAVEYERVVVDTGAVRMIGIPLTAQGQRYTSSVACVRAILRYVGYSFEQQEDILIQILEASEESGTPMKKIASFLNRAGGYEGEKERRVCAKVKVHMGTGGLRHALEEGNPVICLIQAWRGDGIQPCSYKDEWGCGHYVVAVGCDADRIFFMDPFAPGSYTYLPKSELKARWHGVDSKYGRCMQAGVVLAVKRPPRRLDAFYKVL